MNTPVQNPQAAACYIVGLRVSRLAAFKKRLIKEDTVRFRKWMLVLCGLGVVLLGISANAQQEKTVSVVLTQPWTDTGLMVSQGQTISISAAGELNWFTYGCPVSGACITTPDGDPWSTCQNFTPPYVAPGLACWSLIGIIGPSGTPFQVGSSLTNFSAPSSGELYLGVNDNNFPDNTGNWTATISLGQPPACAITSETLATVPGINNNSRRSIGVGESVRLTTQVSANWTITSASGIGLAENLTAIRPPRGPRLYPPGEGLPSERCSEDTSSEVADSPQACFIAPYSNDIIIVTASVDGSSCSATFNAVQPTGIIFRRLQYPVINSSLSPDYRFTNNYGFGIFFQIEMESVAFLTPGNVSFANIEISEHDVTPPNRPFFGYKFNSLYNVNGTNAWLLSCDWDKIHYDFTVVPHSEQADWVFAGLDLGHETPFSTVETAWSVNLSQDLPYGEAHFSKGQVAALAPDGSFMATPAAPAASLNVPAVNFDDFIHVPNHAVCLNQVGAQFSIVH